MPEAELLLDARAALGEGPAWDASAGCLYWVDILPGNVHVFQPESGRDEVYTLGEPVGCLAPCKSGGLILGLRQGIAALDLPAARLTRLAAPEAGLPHNRFNDGKCDPAGRFLAGSMDLNEVKGPSGALYSFTPQGQVTRLLEGLTISNGLTWSPDYRTFYHIDTPTRRVMAYDYDLASGAISRPRVAITVPPEMGLPDGMTTDLEGNLWIALWDGAAVSVWEPGGRLIRTIPIPAPRTTACIFGGAGMDELFVTSARTGLSPEQLAAWPLSGGLFRVRTGARGLPTFAFGQ